MAMMPNVIGRAFAHQAMLGRFSAAKGMKGFAGVSRTANSAEAVSRSSRFGTWVRNRPTWQKYAAGGTVGIVGARAVFGGRNDNRTTYGY